MTSPPFNPWHRKLWGVLAVFTLSVFVIAVAAYDHAAAWWFMLDGIIAGGLFVLGLRIAYGLGAQAAYLDSARQLEALKDDFVVLERAKTGERQTDWEGPS